MRSAIRSCLTAAVLAALPPMAALAASPAAPSAPPAASPSVPAEGKLSVTFVDAQHYTDAAYTHPYASDKDLAAVEGDIFRHLQKLARRGLPPGDTLKIEVLDIDLAGRFEPWRFPGTDLRVVRDITWPRMTLRYTLSRGDRVLASAEERISDMNFMMSANLYPDSDPLRYEKAMLDDWFDTRIVKRVATQASRAEPG
ncbi:DUF3016 domain-containing protein [Cupriavidus sp. 30B13]|uniref:DUF3016 domain-containing protein n=1 Tax=Cupriavidus sp. 30B13 TaxID=3384241 RepID=UPI003B8F859D